MRFTLEVCTKGLNQQVSFECQKRSENEKLNDGSKKKDASFFDNIPIDLVKEVKNEKQIRGYYFIANNMAHELCRKLERSGNITSWLV